MNVATDAELLASMSGILTLTSFKLFAYYKLISFKYFQFKIYMKYIFRYTRFQFSPSINLLCLIYRINSFNKIRHDPCVNISYLNERQMIAEKIIF